MPQIFSVGAPSRFVTGIAWIAMLFAALFVITAVLPQGLLPAAFAEAPQAGLVAWQPWGLAAAVLLSLATALAAGGLLKRLEWGRRLFIGAGVLAVIAHLPNLWRHYESLRGLIAQALHEAVPLPPMVVQWLEELLLGANGLALVLGVGLALLVVWIVRRLSSPGIRQEFA